MTTQPKPAPRWLKIIAYALVISMTILLTLFTIFINLLIWLP